MPPITGSTDVYLIVGDPVEQVQAPAVLNAVFARMGINAVMVPVQIAPAQLPGLVRAAFQASNIKGLLATIPHKGALLDLVDHSSPVARLAGAVNAVRRQADGQLDGALFDGEGLRAALDYFGMHYQGQRVLVLGAGGAASAIAASLASATPAAAEVALYDPLPGKAAALAQRIAQGTQTHVRATNSNDPSGFDLVINASPLGLHAEDALPCEVQGLDASAAVLDIVMKNQPTPWVRAARSRGLNAQPGFEMLIQQAAQYLAFFGFSDAARMVREDANFLRELIYPLALRGEIRGAQPHLLIPALL
jgi:shikimate dehydrogenase